MNSKYKFSNGDPIPVSAIIKQRRRQLIVHSFGYYRLNDNIVSDHQYDAWSKELVSLQSEFPEIAQKVELHEHFKEFDGSTGYDLPTHLPWVASVWCKLKEFNKEEL